MIYSKLDLIYYLELCNKFDKLLHVVLDSNQLKLFNVEFKHNLYSESVKNENDCHVDLLEIINDFSKKNEEVGYEPFDKRLIENIKPMLKKYFKKE